MNKYKWSALAVALGLITACQPANAATYGTSWSIGTSTVNGTSQGVSTMNKTTTTVVTGVTSLSSSNETTVANETSVTNHTSAFGMASAFTSQELMAGGLSIAAREDTGSGWSTGMSSTLTTGENITTGLETGTIIDEDGNTGSSEVNYTYTETYENTTEVETSDSFEFGSYTVTVSSGQ